MPRTVTELIGPAHELETIYLWVERGEDPYHITPYVLTNAILQSLEVWACPESSQLAADVWDREGEEIHSFSAKSVGSEGRHHMLQRRGQEC